uniref:Uncharacterized protein n=1 Tax=Anopheles dirus TaxID=7168 RepID=A0A182N2L1_9DIPT
MEFEHPPRHQNSQPAVVKQPQTHYQQPQYQHQQPQTQYQRPQYQYQQPVVVQQPQFPQHPQYHQPSNQQPAYQQFKNSSTTNYYGGETPSGYLPYSSQQLPALGPSYYFNSSWNAIISIHRAGEESVHILWWDPKELDKSKEPGSVQN